MTRIAIVGFGQLGRGVVKAIERNADMELVAIFTRRPENVRKEIKEENVIVLHTDKLSSSSLMEMIDVAILCVGSKDDIPIIGPLVAKNYNAVCSFDVHDEIAEYYAQIDEIAQKSGKVYMLSNGFDPGFFSLMRIIGDAVLPDSKAYTFYGPGVSQGHSNAARGVPGVKDAKSYTLPVEESVRRIRAGETPELSKKELIWRKVVVVPEDGADQEEIRAEIVKMPRQFAEYHTEVEFITDEEMKRDHSASPHGGFVLISGVTGDGNRQVIEYKLDLGSNPEFTASVLVAFARAAHRMNYYGCKGAFVSAEIPLITISPRSKDSLIDVPFM